MEDVKPMTEFTGALKAIDGSDLVRPIKGEFRSPGPISGWFIIPGQFGVAKSPPLSLVGYSFVLEIRGVGNIPVRVRPEKGGNDSFVHYHFDADLPGTFDELALMVACDAVEAAGMPDQAAWFRSKVRDEAGQREFEATIGKYRHILYPPKDSTASGEV
jgi:hypothetical protein